MAGSNSVAEARDSCLEPVSCRADSGDHQFVVNAVADNDASDLS
jgi:hypothetical protein